MKKILSLFGSVAISSLLLLSCARGGNDNNDGDFGSSNSAKNATWLHYLWDVTHYKVGEGGSYRAVYHDPYLVDNVLDFLPDGNLYYGRINISDIDMRTIELAYKVKGKKLRF